MEVGLVEPDRQKNVFDSLCDETRDCVKMVEDCGRVTRWIRDDIGAMEERTDICKRMAEISVLKEQAWQDGNADAYDKLWDEQKLLSCELVILDTEREVVRRCKRIIREREKLERCSLND